MDSTGFFQRMKHKHRAAFWGTLNVATNRCLCRAPKLLSQRARLEFDLLPWCQKRQMPVMAYSPVGQGGRLLKNKALLEVARRHHSTPAQIAIAWALRKPGVIAIPKASNLDHVRENAAASSIKLTADDLAAIDGAFAPPNKKRPLQML